MNLTRTIRIRLDANPKDILPTLNAYTKAFNLVCQAGFKDSDTNGVSLHHKTYDLCKNILPPAQLRVSARMKATEVLKSVKELQKKFNRKNPNNPKIFKCPQSKLCPVRLDARSYSLWFERLECTIRLQDERKTFGFKLNTHAKQFVSWKQCSADLIVRDNKVFLNMVVEKEQNDPIPTDRIVGMDSGINRIAVTSDNKFYGGGTLSHVRTRFKNLRRILQKKGHSGKRHLVRIKGQENRFVRDCLHVVSKKIVAGLRPGDSIAMEDLKDIRERCKFGKEQRTRLHSWAFDKLQGFVGYKAEAKGCSVLKVEARNTSRTCHRCGYCDKNNRKSQSLFLCKQCQNSLNADLNASKNIARKGEIILAKRQNDGLSPISLMLPAVLGSSKPSGL